MSELEHDEREPVRLSSAASSAHPALRAALSAGRAEQPSAAQLGSLAARLAPLAAPVAAGLALGAWPLVASVVATVVIGVAVGYVALGPRSPAEPPRAARPPAVLLDASPSELQPPIDASVPAAEVDAAVRVAVVAVHERGPRAAGVADAGPASAPPLPEVDVEAELALLRSAQDALRASPATALSIAEEHARRFGDGTLAQEREVVAIEALAALSRLPEARARAERFSARWPRSAHARRLAVILAEPSP
jgi:hypothetical protein